MKRKTKGAKALEEEKVEVFKTFIPISKIYEPEDPKSDEPLIFEGYATTGAVDLEDQIVDPEFIRAALPEYLKWGNIRDSHRADKPIGTLLEGGSKIDQIGWYVAGKIIDQESKQKIRHGVFKGISVGLANCQPKAHKTAKRGFLTFKDDGSPARIVEISLCDRPLNPEAVITAFKADLQGTVEKNDLVRPPSAFPDGIEVIVKKSVDVELPAALTEAPVVLAPAAAPAVVEAVNVSPEESALQEQAKALLAGVSGLSPEQEAQFYQAFVAAGLAKTAVAEVKKEPNADTGLMGAAVEKQPAPAAAATPGPYAPPTFAEMWAGHEIADKLPEMMDVLRSAIYNGVWMDGSFDERAGHIRTSVENFITAVLKPLTELPATKSLKAAEAAKKAFDPKATTKAGTDPEAQKAVEVLREEVAKLTGELDKFRGMVAPAKAVKYAEGGGPEVGTAAAGGGETKGAGFSVDEISTVLRALASHPSDDVRRLASEIGPKFAMHMLTMGAQKGK